MSLYELEIDWVETEGDRRYLQWELLACPEIVGVFATEREHVLAVLFDGGYAQFRNWACGLAEPATMKGAMQ